MNVFFKKMKKYYVILFLYCFVYITTHTSGIYATDGSYMTFSYNILIMTLVCLLTVLKTDAAKDAGCSCVTWYNCGLWCQRSVNLYCYFITFISMVQICFFFCLEKNHTVLFLYRWRIWSVHGKEYNY